MSIDTKDAALGAYVDIEIVEDVAPYEDDGTEGENFTHIVNPTMNLDIWKPGMSSQDIVDVARFRGLTVTSLCGKTWVPKRNPDKYPACDTCIEIAGDLIRGAGK